ncbi:DMT family transporter [Roseovarius sp. EL26]|uniref:DMT family transporter n=1 Tax=Roseovarius sp. EL26 TaxID=2126672 RepID=UPI000EA3A520|nr:DMT family transporter [Roseovarius sp. EL26]
MSATTTTSVETFRDPHGIMFVCLSGVLWSTVGLGIRLIEDVQVWQILFYRSFGLSALLYVVILFRTGESPFKLVWLTGWAGLIGALALVAAYSGGIYAMQTTSVANAMLLFASAPFMAAILGLIVLREQVKPHTWGAIAVALVGIGIMVWDESGSTAVIGNIAALASAFGFAVFTIALRWGKNGEMLPIVFLSGLLAIVIMGAICLILDLPLTLSQRDGAIALTMGVFQVGAGLVLYTLGSKSVPAAELTLLSLAEVILGPFWVWLFLGEMISRYTLLGGAILLLAIAGNTAFSARRRRPPPRI